ncbi:MAG: signal peptidase I [Armatimonadota bacterium]|nr:signal peptidase I [Armatimonadota bacterium]
MSGMPGQRATRVLMEWTLLLTGIAGAILMRVYVVLPAYVPSKSMEPTLRVGDHVFINRFAFRRRLPSPGEVVALNTLDRQEVWVKRVVAGPGDRVGLRRGVLYRNGQPVKETYVLQRMGVNARTVTVPANHVFVLGDNRDNSDDSRDWGPLRRDFLVGKVVFIYWPPGRMGWVR